MNALLRSLRRLFRRRTVASKPSEADRRSDLAHRLVSIIEVTQPDECTCEETYALIDQFSEALESGEDVSQLMPLVMRHLEVCTDCKEEFEALLRVMQASPGDQ